MRRRMRAIFWYDLIILRYVLPLQAESFLRIDARLSGLGFCSPLMLAHPPGSRWLSHDSSFHSEPEFAARFTPESGAVRV
jgi:hypothetical protein